MIWQLISTDLRVITSNSTAKLRSDKPTCTSTYEHCCKFRHNNKKCETCVFKYQYCDCFLEYTNFKDDLIEYKCLCCNKNYQRKFDEKLKERFFSTYKFSNHDNNQFILLLQKLVYPYEYMDDSERFNKTSLPEKEDFYSHLNMERY